MKTRINIFFSHKGSILLCILVLGFGVYFALPKVFGDTYSRDDIQTETIPLSTETPAVTPLEIPKPIITHVTTPAQVKGIYMSSWVAGTPSFRNKLIQIADDTEINTVVIDIKDSTGRISFKIDDQVIINSGAVENRIADIADLITELHAKNIYVVGRVAVFQDPYFVKMHPEFAVKKLSNKENLWSDHKGIHWLDAGSKDVWEYVSTISKIAYTMGFDEINFDYIRFPSDGNMRDIYFPISDGKVKHDVIREFYEYLHATFEPLRIPISGDLFGMVTTATDDMNIGQLLEDGLRNFDYVAPMVYPSHYPATWNGYANPATKPYEIIQKSMQGAVDKANAIPVDIKKLRPWLQDFDLGATYTADMVRAQIKATYDVGLDSWLLWDAGNTYTVDALEK
jgi:hypothetical protein